MSRPHNAPPPEPEAGQVISKPFLLRMAGNHQRNHAASGPTGAGQEISKPFLLRMAGNLSFSLRASEAPPAILGASEAARRLPGPKNRIFLKLAALISELPLRSPWASLSLPEPLWPPLAAPELPWKPWSAKPSSAQLSAAQPRPGHPCKN